MDPSPSSAAEGDLVLLAQAFLEERIGYADFRHLLLETWADLKRGALSADDRRAWADIVNAARQTTPESMDSGSPKPLFDHGLFWDSLFLVLFEDTDGNRSGRSHRAREIRDSISRVLLEEWDPIGVGDVADASDEYDSYVGEMYSLRQAQRPRRLPPISSRSKSPQ